MVMFTFYLHVLCHDHYQKSKEVFDYFILHDSTLLLAKEINYAHIASSQPVWLSQMKVDATEQLTMESKKAHRGGKAFGLWWHSADGTILYLLTPHKLLIQPHHVSYFMPNIHHCMLCSVHKYDDKWLTFYRNRDRCHKEWGYVATLYSLIWVFDLIHLHHFH